MGGFTPVRGLFFARASLQLRRAFSARGPTVVPRFGVAAPLFCSIRPSSPAARGCFPGGNTLLPRGGALARRDERSVNVGDDFQRVIWATAHRTKCENRS